MFDLTPGERRGALLLLAVCALGALYDLSRSRVRPAPPAPPVILTPAGPEPAAAPDRPGVAGGAEAASPARLDLNTAGAAELDALPGIGPVLAARIVAQRAAHGPYHEVDELLSVQGIGPRLLERLRPRVRLGASRTAADSAVQNATPLMW